MKIGTNISKQTYLILCSSPQCYQELVSMAFPGAPTRPLLSSMNDFRLFGY